MPAPHQEQRGKWVPLSLQVGFPPPCLTAQKEQRKGSDTDLIGYEAVGRHSLLKGILILTF